MMLSLSISFFDFPIWLAFNVSPRSTLRHSVLIVDGFTSKLEK